MASNLCYVTEAVLTKQKIEPDKVDRLKEWMDEVRERESEVIETFQSEGMLTEAAFLEQGTTACTSSISWKLKTYAKFTSRSVNQRMISIRNRKRSWTMFWKVPRILESETTNCSIIIWSIQTGRFSR